MYKNERQNTKSQTNTSHNGVVPQLKISDDFNTMKLKLLIDPDIENWNKLLNKTEENKLKSSAICPFCYGKKNL
jgi:hypothetical protein